MKRSRLKNMANKINCPDDIDRFRRQRNLLVKLNEAAKKSFLNKIEPPQSRSKSFWKLCKPMFSSNVNNIEKMSKSLILVENNAIILMKGRFPKFSIYICHVLPNYLGYSIGEKTVYKHPRTT